MHGVSSRRCPPILPWPRTPASGASWHRACRGCRAWRRGARTRRVRWTRVVAAGMVTAGLAGLSFGILPALLRSTPAIPAAISAPPASPQVADAVQNLDFYEWLASHPQALGTENGHDGAA